MDARLDRQRGIEMTISVCMGLYNGERYIKEQLLSILYQTRQPDEVILCDDGSTDRTVELVRDFINNNRLEKKWKLYVNEKNKGYPANFYDAMELCDGDIVFLSDQDDVWAKEKLERMLQGMESHPGAKAVCCKFGLIDAKGEQIHTIMQPAKSKGSGIWKRVTVEDVFYKCEWPGMVVAYRNEWYRSRKERKKLSVPHDFFVCAAAAEEEGFWQLDEELAWHRRHESNAGGEEHRLKKLLNKERKLREIEEYLRILEAFEGEGALKTKRGRKALSEKRISMEGRYEALKSGKIGRVLKNARENWGNVRLAALVCDLMIVRQRDR